MGEHDHQKALFQWAEIANLPGIELMYAIPNGGHRHAAVAAKLKAEGVENEEERRMNNPIDSLVMFCCGYCGQPTNDKGEPLEVIPDNFDLPNAEMVHGLCCAAQA